MSLSTSEIIEHIEKIDWEFSDADTQYLTHNIHRYSGKFIPQIAQEVIKILSEPGDIIFDPYMGSGTAILEALLLGRNAVGIDLNPLAVLIANVKTLKINPKTVEEIKEVVIPGVKDMLNGGQISLFDIPDGAGDGENKEPSINGERETDEWHTKWFQPHVLSQLIRIYDLIGKLKGERAKDIATVAFSDILRKSSNASSKYPNVMYDKVSKKKPLPAASFLESLNSVIDGLTALSEKLPENVCSRLELRNNLNTGLDDNSVDAIITHPPYIAAIPYAEYGSLSLRWLGYDDRALDKELTGGQRHSKKVVDRFSKDYMLFFMECFRVLKPGRFAFFMVGNPTSNGAVVPLDEMTTDYAKKAGFKHITTTVRNGLNRRGNNMGCEYLIFVQK